MAILHDYWRKIRASRIMNLFFFHASKKWGSTEKTTFSGFPGFGEENLTLAHPGFAEAEHLRIIIIPIICTLANSIACVWHFVAGWFSLEFGKSQDFEM